MVQKFSSSGVCNGDYCNTFKVTEAADAKMAGYGKLIKKRQVVDFIEMGENPLTKSIIPGSGSNPPLNSVS